MPRAAKNLAIFNCNAQMMLEGRDYNGAKIFLYRVGNLNLTKDTDDKVTNEQVFLSNILTLEWSLLDPKTQIAGVTVLADLEGFSLSTHASLLSPYYTRKSAEVIQDTFPLRFKGIHIVNQPGYFDAVYAVVKPFLKPKVKQRVYLHGKNFDELHKYLPPSVLPTEYGGQLPTADNKNWREQLFKDLPLILGETDGCEEETADSELKTNNLNLSTT
ncbi:hypothetical protein O3M35_004870 [Rhynocoris fuscipes]|uniref:CRAL-TRIO domain-containing protein n=1 Tax=Rhynocoris fuscipes TaxID=488301 RepID=A0AAW1DG20_9HEMI